MRIYLSTQKTIINLDKIISIDKIDGEKKHEYGQVLPSYNIRFNFEDERKYSFWYFEEEYLRDQVFERICKKHCSNLLDN